MLNTSSELRQKRHSALRGNKPSQEELAIQYFNGDGVMQDQIKALRLFKKATGESHDAEAFLQLSASAHEAHRLFKSSSAKENKAPESQEKSPANTIS